MTVISSIGPNDPQFNREGVLMQGSAGQQDDSSVMQISDKQYLSSDMSAEEITTALDDAKIEMDTVNDGFTNNIWKERVPIEPIQLPKQEPEKSHFINDSRIKTGKDKDGNEYKYVTVEEFGSRDYSSKENSSIDNIILNSYNLSDYGIDINAKDYMESDAYKKLKELVMEANKKQYPDGINTKYLIANTEFILPDISVNDLVPKPEYPEPDRIRYL